MPFFIYTCTMKFAHFLIPALLILVMASCKRDYSCTCSTTMHGTTVDSLIPVRDTKKKAAKDECSRLQTDMQITATPKGGVVTCVL